MGGHHDLPIVPQHSPRPPPHTQITHTTVSRPDYHQSPQSGENRMLLIKYIFREGFLHSCTITIIRKLNVVHILLPVGLTVFTVESSPAQAVEINVSVSW